MNSDHYTKTWGEHDDFTKVADKYDLVKVDDTLDYEGEFSEDL